MKSLKIKSLSLVTILAIMAFNFSSCSTKAKKAADSDSNSDSNSVNLDLNGSSDEGNAGALQTIYFAYDSSNLTANSRAVLAENVAFLKASQNIDIQVEGHCDERGGAQYNLALGERRARAVQDYLVAMGINRSRISLISYGKEKPVSFGHDESAWSRNRRANFVITAK